ncbi:HelD family protein [Clostridium sp. WILCCON 0269]|uniref:HelD family protein n=1 Tax=Candidatus Clostridium eludens TaxID=3381663 RepID=A0ABW8SGV6_9CLOT
MYTEDSKKELERNFELNLEKEKLKEVLKEINVQILNYVNLRKEVVSSILDLREKNLEQYKDDEDQYVEYFSHEMYAREEQYRLVNKSIREFTILTLSPYFGKLNFKDSYGNETIYIGRFGMTRKEDYEPIVVDWRSPVCALFYAGKLGLIKYKSPAGEIETEVLSKRQFIIKKSNLLGMFDSSMDVKDEILQMVLSKNAGEKLKDIVMTIQREQDNLIRQPRKGAVVVNGVAGSGKTTIALHRVAYLLYNYRKILQEKVLILGPNSIFIDYISMVLPSLGEEKVIQTTFREFFGSMLNLPDIMDLRDYVENILDKNNKFIDEIMYKGSLEYMSDMDELVNNIEETYFKIDDVLFYDKAIISKEQIYKMLRYDFKSMPLFKRIRRLKRVIYSKIKDERNILVGFIQEEYKDKIKNMTESQLNDFQTNLEYKRRNKIRNVICEIIKIKKEKLKWMDEPDVVSIYNDFNENKQLIHDDLAAILYLKIRLQGLKYNRGIRHIVIDEAQDYSPLQFRVIKELTDCKSFTIVGDINQRIISSEQEPAMLHLKDIFSDIEVKNFSLDRSYRSTNEIISYANKYLKYNKIISLVRKGMEVIEKQMDNHKELVDKILDDVVKLKERGYESIAIICRDLKNAEALSNLIKRRIHINLINREDMIYSSGEVILPGYFAKGLEFDAVIMIDTSQDDDTLKYIMATRALHELYVYKTSSIN